MMRIFEKIKKMEDQAEHNISARSDFPTLTETLTPVKINDYLDMHKEIPHLRQIIMDASMVSGAVTIIGLAQIESLTFTDDDYIVADGKCFMTLMNDGNEYQAFSIFVEPSKRGKGHAAVFLSKEFDTDRMIMVNTRIEGLIKTVDANSTLRSFDLFTD